MQRLVTHDVPVHLIPLSHWQEYEEPGMPEFDISFYLPPLRKLRNVTYREINFRNPWKIYRMPNYLTHAISWDFRRLYQEISGGFIVLFIVLHIRRHLTVLPLKVLERIKNLSNHVTVQGSWSGEMTLSVKTELVTTKTYFTDLDIPQLDSQVGWSHAKIDCRFLHWHKALI